MIAATLKFLPGTQTRSNEGSVAKVRITTGHESEEEKVAGKLIYLLTGVK
jgi:hypothetical protein